MFRNSIVLRVALSTVFMIPPVAPSASAADPENRLIDYQGFAKQVETVGELRAKRRISQADFIEMARDSETIVLDARSKEKFDMLHVKGAHHLNFSDMTEEDLARIIPTKTTRVLIYCNNNFLNAPVAMPTKTVTASLNVHTFNALHAYGYSNVFELKPLLDMKTTQIPFEGSNAKNSESPEPDNSPSDKPR